MNVEMIKKKYTFKYNKTASLLSGVKSPVCHRILYSTDLFKAADSFKKSCSYLVNSSLALVILLNYICYFLIISEFNTIPIKF